MKILSYLKHALKKRFRYYLTKMDIYKEMRSALRKAGYKKGDYYGEKYFDDKIFKVLSDPSINNIKGTTFEDRFRDILSDPNNLFIPRVVNSGKLENDVLTLHNDIKIHNRCYYDNFTDILILNKGVHEPSEERLFAKVLEFIDDNATMIELGSYWAFYSMWFLKDIKNGKSYCIEPDENCLEIGKNNFKLNNFKGDFTQGFIGGENGLDLLSFVKDKNIDYIDILHSDIQGFEGDMINQVKPLLMDKKIKYFFISTHSDQLHRDCTQVLKECNYRVICSCDFDSETFQFDGFLLACPASLNEIPNLEIGNRKHAKLISEEYFKEVYKRYITDWR